jgi:hypothetical protein
MRWWFQGGPEIDTEITERFGGVLEQARRGELDSWAETPRGRLALIVVLDQFSRNVYRGSSLSYAQDEKALELAVEGIDTGMDREWGPMEQIFFWMPPRSLGGSSPPGSGRPPPRGESGEGPTPAEGDGRVRDLSGQGSTRRHSPLRASPAPQRDTGTHLHARRARVPEDRDTATHAPTAFLRSIHPSAWKGCSRRSTSSILHSPTPIRGYRTPASGELLRDRGSIVHKLCTADPWR